MILTKSEKNMKKLLYSFIIGFILLVNLGFSEKNPERDLMSDTWIATDGIGRTLSDYKKVGPKRKNKVVGIFYFTWHGVHGYDNHCNPSDEGQGVIPKTKKDYKGPYDISEIIKHEPGKRPWGPPWSFHHWGESEWGYYLSDDEFVIRKHIQMFVDADVDVLILDATNGATYRDIYLKICKIIQEMRDSGERTPQVTFIANSGSPDVVKKIYEEFYEKKLYPELWFYWKGKPLMLSPFEGLEKKLADFFTFRHSWAWSTAPWFQGKPAPWFGDGKDKWPWIDYYPQNPGWHDNSNKAEQISVSVASHPMFNIGKSYHNGNQPTEDKFKTAEGAHFAEHWKRAIEVDPEFVFICGWNEWTAMRIISKGEHEGMFGKPIPKGGSFFVDLYDAEYNRDIEPMKGGYYDSFYYQMADNIRKYKGVRKSPKASPQKTIFIDGKFKDWEDVTPEFKDQTGDVFHRNHPGWGRIKSYVNKTGRNDFKNLKVARDDKNIYFYAETDKDISSYKDKNWMMLFIDADANPLTGWEGYDYLINNKIIDFQTATIEKFSGTNKLVKVGKIKYRVKRNKLELSIPRKFLGLKNKKEFILDFHWADNIQKLFDIIEFSENGDSAPNRRFKYRYER